MREQGAMGRVGGVVAWTGVSLVGFAAGFLLVFGGGVALLDALVGDVDRLFDEVAWFFPVMLTAAFSLGGAGLAAAQWLLLRRHADGGAARWVGGMAVGNATLAVLYLALYEAIPSLANEIVHNVAAGLVIGAVQAPVVRPLTRSRPWPVVTTLAMLGAATVSWLVVQATGDDFLGGPLGMATYGLVTGVVLHRAIVSRPEVAAPVRAGVSGS